MFLLSRPDAGAIERFVRESEDLPLSYAPIGLVEAPTRRHSVDEVVIAIGRGTLDFDRARAALAAWKHFELGWVELAPRHAAPDPGTTVAVLIRHLGFWSLNGARVVKPSTATPRGSASPTTRWPTMRNLARSSSKCSAIARPTRSATGSAPCRRRAQCWRDWRIRSRACCRRASGAIRPARCNVRWHEARTVDINLPVDEAGVIRQRGSHAGRPPASSP